MQGNHPPGASKSAPSCLSEEPAWPNQSAIARGGTRCRRTCFQGTECDNCAVTGPVTEACNVHAGKSGRCENAESDVASDTTQGNKTTSTIPVTRKTDLRNRWLGARLPGKQFSSLQVRPGGCARNNLENLGPHSLSQSGPRLDDRTKTITVILCQIVSRGHCSWHCNIFACPC